MKKYLSIILICCMALSLLAGCGSSNASDSSAAGESPAAEAVPERLSALEWDILRQTTIRLTTPVNTSQDL